MAHHPEGGQSPHHNLLTLVIGSGMTCDPIRANQMQGGLGGESWEGDSHSYLNLEANWPQAAAILPPGVTGPHRVHCGLEGIFG